MPRVLTISITFLAAAAPIAACGSDASPRPDGAPTIVVAMPHEGPQARIGRDTERAARMQFESEAGRRGLPAGIKLRFVDESVPGRDSSDPAHVADVTEAALSRHAVVGWIGGVDSDALAVELPRLNDDGIPTVSPSATATPFLQADPAFPGAPAKYFPAIARFGRTFARTAPSDRLIASRCLNALRRQFPLAKVFTVDAGDTDGDSFSSAVDQAAPRSGIRVVGHESAPSQDADWSGVAAQIAAAAPDAVVWSSGSGMGETDFKAALKEDRWEGPIIAGPALVPSRLRLLASPHSSAGPSAYGCSASVPATQQAVGSEVFAKSFQRRWGHAPEAGSVRGAAAMALLLDSLAAAGPPGSGSSVERIRSSAVRSLRRVRSVDSLIGRLSLSMNGQWTDAPLVIWGVGSTAADPSERLNASRIK